MYNKDNFQLGEMVDLTIYEHDSQGNESLKVVKGKVHQITGSFVVINNGKYKESFQYSQLEKNDNSNILNGDPYDLSLQSYSDDVIDECLNMLKNGKSGYVFTSEQMYEVIKSIPDIIKETRGDYCCEKKDNMYFIKKI